jgi:hypothetical protein
MTQHHTVNGLRVGLHFASNALACSRRPEASPTPKLPRKVSVTPEVTS